MLKALRNKQTQKSIYIVIAVAVVATFAMSGIILTTVDKKSSTALGVIGNHPISAQEFLASYRAVERQASWMYGDKIKGIVKFMNLKGEAWDRLLLVDHAKIEKIKVSDGEVVDWVTSQNAFQNKGRFDERIYKGYVQQAFRSDARQFEEEIRQMLMIAKINDKLRSEVSVSAEELKKLYVEDKKERDIEYSVLMADEKSADLKTPEDAVKKLELTQDKLEWKKFEKLGKTKSVPELGPLAPLNSVLSSLKEGETSAVFQVPGGAAIVKLAKDYPVDEKQFETDKEKFRQETVDAKTQDKMQALLTKLRNDLKMNLEVMKQIFPEEEAGSQPSARN